MVSFRRFGYLHGGCLEILLCIPWFAHKLKKITTRTEYNRNKSIFVFTFGFKFENAEQN